MQYDKPQKERKEIAKTAYYQMEAMQRWQRYSEPWTHEGEAHMTIEPELWKMLEKKPAKYRIMDFFK